MMQARQSSRVDLPELDGPVRATISPSRTSRSTPLKDGRPVVGVGETSAAEHW